MLNDVFDNLERNRHMTKTIMSLIVVLFLSSLAPAIQAETINDKKVCIDAGHQQKGNNKKEPIAPNSKTTKAKVSSGTTGVSTKIPEYVFNLRVALKLQKELEERGYTVFMTRTTHKVNLSNVDRAKYCNDKKADLTVRIHADGTNKNVNGIHVLYPSGKHTKSINTQSADAAAKILTALIKETGAKKAYGKGLSPRTDITGFNWSKHPVVLPELGFMSNATEDKKLADPQYQEKLATGIANGIDTYFKGNEVSSLRE